MPLASKTQITPRSVNRAPSRMTQVLCAADCRRVTLATRNISTVNPRLSPGPAYDLVLRPLLFQDEVR